mmetsp:Transcript_58503/g.126561  ORF Transcript_58503/g.126561 Transcript_58503/m.126561 type:complete len:332 (+) Transcript_58503:160-1155(+)
MYRYSRGQSSGQGTLPRPAWGSGGSHGARTASPEPEGATSALLGGSGDAARDRLGTTPQDEVILQLETELVELRNACAWRDQRIADLSRTDTPIGRLKRDVRQLASELHHTRKKLSESHCEMQELLQQIARLEGGVDSHTDGTALSRRDLVDSAHAAVGGAEKATIGKLQGDRGLRERMGFLEDENKQLREMVAQLQSSTSRGTPTGSRQAMDGSHHARQLSGASTQRAPEPAPPGSHVRAGESFAAGTSFAAGNASRGLAGGGQTGGGSGQAAPPEETVRQIVYSSAHPENAAVIGPVTLQGVGTVDGVASVAKVLLQRIHSSVCAAHRM